MLRSQSRLPVHGKRGFAVASAIAALVFLFFGISRAMPLTRDCGDVEGLRPLIRHRIFALEYSRHLASLEATLRETRISARLTDAKLQQLLRSLQETTQFRDAIVAGYDGCSVSRGEYVDALKELQTMDTLALEINESLGKPALTENEQTHLRSLIEQFDSSSYSLLNVE